MDSSDARLFAEARHASAPAALSFPSLLAQVRAWLEKGKSAEAARLARDLSRAPYAARESALLSAEIALHGNDPRTALSWVEPYSDPYAARIQGEASLRLGLPRQAAKAFRLSLGVEDPDVRAENILGLGLSLRRLQDPPSRTEAERWLRRALSTGRPATAFRAACVLAEAAGERKDSVSRLHYLRRALFLRPDEPRVQRDYGLLLEESGPGERRSARNFYDGVLRRSPTFFWAHAGLARIEEKAGKIHKAHARWKKVIALDPLNPAPRAERARLAVREDPLRGARLAARMYQEVLSLDPHHAESHRFLAEAALARGEAREAAAHFESFLEATRPRAGAPDPPLFESRPRALLALADLRTQSVSDSPPERRRLMAFLRAAQEEIPTESGILVAVSRAHRAEGNLSAARRAVRRAMREAPSDAAARYEAALVALAENDLSAARTWLDSAVRLSPQPLYLAEAAQFYLRTGDFPRAESLFRDLFALDTTNDWALAGWAIALGRSRRFRKALFAWDRFRVRCPRSPEGALGRAETLLYLGRIQEAEELVRPLVRRKGDLGLAARGLRAALDFAQGRAKRAARRIARLRAHPHILDEIEPILRFVGWR